MRRLALIAFLLVFALAPMGVVFAQENRPRTLFDMLFGDKEETAPPAQKAPKKSSNPARSAAPPALPAVEAQQVEKAAGATRLAVFGDSLAVDLAKALERFYAEDPNLVVVRQGVGSSGFVRDDYFDWNAALSDAIAANSFDIAVIIIGVNDRQPIGDAKPLTEAWKKRYLARLSEFLEQLRTAGKPAIWVGLPPMQANSYSAAMTQISSIHKLAALSGGAEFVDIYERFADENGNYTAHGPDLNGQNALMRKSDGIHFSTAGSDKLAFYVNQALKSFYYGGGVSLEVVDMLANTDAAGMQRPPFQGLGQIRLLEVAGAVMPITGTADKAQELILGWPGQRSESFDLEQMLAAPAGRADAFGVGILPQEAGE